MWSSLHRLARDLRCEAHWIPDPQWYRGGADVSDDFNRYPGKRQEKRDGCSYWDKKLLEALGWNGSAGWLCSNLEQYR